MHQKLKLKKCCKYYASDSVGFWDAGITINKQLCGWFCRWFGSRGSRVSIETNVSLSHNWTRVKFTVRSDGWQIFLPGLFCTSNTCRGAVNFLLCLRSLLIGILNILPLFFLFSFQWKIKVLGVFILSSELIKCFSVWRLKTYCACYLAMYFNNYI